MRLRRFVEIEEEGSWPSPKLCHLHLVQSESACFVSTNGGGRARGLTGRELPNHSLVSFAIVADF